MPEGNDLKHSAPDAVVDEVLDAREEQPSDDVGTRCFDPGADARLFDEQGHSSLDVFAHRSRRGGPISGPPLCRSFDLALCARLDSDVERQESAETAEPREKLFGWNTFFSVGLIKGGNEIRFLVGRELHQRFIAASEDRYGRSLGQR
jgi:hypothetical protein